MASLGGEQEITTHDQSGMCKRKNIASKISTMEKSTPKKKM